MTMNQLCPVCGGRVPEQMPPMELARMDTSDSASRSFRICSPECARIAARDPQRYFAASEAEAIAAAPLMDAET